MTNVESVLEEILSKSGAYLSSDDMLFDCFSRLDCILDLATNLQSEGLSLPFIVPPKDKTPQIDLTFSEVQKQLLKDSQSHIFERAKQSIESGIELEFFRLIAFYQMTEIEILAFLMALAPTYHHKYEKCYATLLGKETEQAPTVMLVNSIFSLWEKGESSRLENAYSPLRRQLFEYNYHGILHIRPRVKIFLKGDNSISGALAMFCHECEVPSTPILVNNHAFAMLTRGLTAWDDGVFLLCGRSGSGKRFLLSHLALALQISIINIDYKALNSSLYAEKEQFYDQLSLESMLSNTYINIYNLPEELEYGEGLIMRLKEISPVLFISCEKAPVLSEISPCVLIDLDKLSISERKLVWENELRKYNFSENINVSQCASLYDITIGRIISTCKEAFAMAIAEGRECVEQSDLSLVINRTGTIELQKLATRITPAYTWDDLMLANEQKDLLKLALNRLILREQVDEKWGFNQKLAYGRGLSLVLCGPPGTGKTMAAQVMAKETGKELFAVDLSRLNSKYIGESEKNIASIFEAAKSSNAILFFDEADSLFTKRTEVQSSNDRYANTGVAFLLQQMENYQGMCILATNLFHNFDQAFVRRISFVVRFQKPTEQERLMMWQAVFPAESLCEGGIDFELFAKKVELSGSEIKSIAYNAAFRAASENKKISPRHIVESLKTEYNKMGNLSIPITLEMLR